MDPLQIIIFIILFFLSAFFSGTELALMSLADHKIESLIKQKKYGAKSLQKIKENNDRLLITILIGNNLVNVYTAALATTIAISIGQSSGLEQATAVGIATGIITLLLLLFGEIIPKSFATKNASSISLFVAPIYKWLMRILYPVIIIIELVINLFSGKENIEKITDEEIESFIDMGKDSGSLDHGEHEKIKNLLEFSDVTVEEIMTPRVKIDAINIESTVEEAMNFFLSHTHSRIPIFTDTIDKIDNFITPRDIIFALKAGNLKKKVKDLDLKEVLKIPLNKPIDTLLETFQKSHKIMAILIDEHGGVEGLVTMEDIIEEVFGEIRDETDKEIDEIKKISDNKYKIRSRVLIEDILEKYDLDLENIGLSEEGFDGENVSYVITHKLERFPVSGEKVPFKIKGEKDKKLVFTVISITDSKIEDIEVELV